MDASPTAAEAMRYRFLLLLLVVFGMQFVMLPLVVSGFIVRTISYVGTALLLFCAASSLLVPVIVGGKTVMHKYPRLQQQLGTIWMSGAIIGASMFCLGVCYALRH